MPASQALYELLRVAHTMDPKALDMDHWAWSTHISPARSPVPGRDCGTTACLLGHAAGDPWFIERKTTLKWEFVEGDPDDQDDLAEWQASVQLDGHDMDEDERIAFFDLPGQHCVAFKARGYFCDADTFLFMPTAYYSTSHPRQNLDGQALKDAILSHIQEVIDVCNMSDHETHAWYEARMVERDELIRSKTNNPHFYSLLVEVPEDVAGEDGSFTVMVPFHVSEDVADAPVTKELVSA
jgi:hypothetical protein